MLKAEGLTASDLVMSEVCFGYSEREEMSRFEVLATKGFCATLQ